MKYDIVIIGGGLSGLVSGILLTKAGRKVAIVSSGHSALHFSSGSFGLFGQRDGNFVEHPLEAIAKLPASHPYSKVGIDAITDYVKRVKPLFAEAGINTHGSEERNHYRLTPIGAFKPAWLTIDDYATVGKPDNLPWGKVAIINFNGYLDFYPSFIAKGLEEAGLSCSLKSFTLPELETLRKSSTEMRAANIARVIVGDVIGDVAREVNRLAGDADTVLMPAVIGLFDDEPVKLLREKVDRPLYFVSTQPMSVGGMRSQIRLRRYFKKLGGTYLLGDSVTNGVAEGDRMMKISTVNLGDMELSADYFILASGSFFSYGIMANPVSIYEPIFGLDVKAPTTRSEWYHKDIFKDHAYMKYGVTTDDEFRVMKDGRTLDNMYAVGAVLGGCNSMKEESGAGVALMTSMKVVDNILAR